MKFVADYCVMRLPGPQEGRIKTVEFESENHLGTPKNRKDAWDSARKQEGELLDGWYIRIGKVRAK